MKQEESDILFKDLCCRIPYGVKLFHTLTNEITNLEMIGNGVIDGNIHDLIENFKPYLFPLSSMTEEQRKEFVKFACYEPRLEDCGRHKELYYYDLVGHENNFYPNSDAIDWLNKNHFDYRGLIPMGLAIDATGLNIYKKLKL